MDTLGVEVRVVTPTAREGSRPILGRSEGNYIVPSGVAETAGPRADWISYRTSIARVHKREQNGDEPLTCPSCGTETDVTEIVHSPKCRHVAAPTSREPEGLDLLEQMDRGERIARPAPIEGEPMPELVCKIDGCDRDASDAPKAGPTSRLCATHRAERSRQISEARTGRPRSTRATRRTGGGNASKKKRSRTVRTTAKAVPRSVAANGSHASKAERLLAAARAVDEIEAQLAQARAELKDAAAALA